MYGACGWEDYSQNAYIRGSAVSPGPEECCMAEVRFEDAKACEHAIGKLNNAEFKGRALQMALDPQSKDRTKVIVTGVPVDVDWQELKDHFNTVPKVAFVAVIGNKRNLIQDAPNMIGEVRMESAAEAGQAMEFLQGSAIGGTGALKITMDQRSKDGTKLVVTEIPAGVTWQELKVHFMQYGRVAFANVFAGSAYGTLSGEVRYDDPNHTLQAYRSLNGSLLGGSKIYLTFAPGSVDNSKLLVEGIPPGTGWQEMKDHFSQVGQVAFAQVSEKGISKGGKGGGKGGGHHWAGGGGAWNGDMVPMMMMVPMDQGGQMDAYSGGQAWSGGGGGRGGRSYGSSYGKAGGGGGKAVFNMPYVKGYGNVW